MRFRIPPKGMTLVRWKKEWEDSLGIIRRSDITFVIEGVLEIIKCILLIPVIYLMSALIFPIVLAKGYCTCYRYCFYKLTEEEEKYVQELLGKYGKNT
jgi:hypothetical protein